MADPFISAEELTPGKPGTIEPRPYTLRANPGEAGVSVNRGGMPVRTLIEKAGPDPDAIGYLTVARPNGTVAYLPGADFAEPPPFPEGPALVSVDVNSTRFFRPLGADPADLNAEDNIATAGDESLQIGLHDGNVLVVAASASTGSAEPGQAVQLSASASGAREGEQVSIRWSFGDGSGAEGASVSHSFGGSGTYEVRATAVGNEESGGESGPVFVVVGNPPTSRQPGAAPAEARPTESEPAGPSGRGSPGRGGDGGKQQGGDRPSRGDGKNVGAETGAPAAAASPPASETGSEASVPAPVEAAPLSGSSAPSESGAGAPAPNAKPSQPLQPATSEAETVEGTLVANYLDSAAAAAAAASSSNGSESAPGASDGGEATLPVAALIVLALLAAGALYEWRGTRARTR